MKHNTKYKKHEHSIQKPAPVINTTTEKILEPTVREEEIIKHPESIMATTSPEKKETTAPIKEMHAEIASVSAELAKKMPSTSPAKERDSLMVPVAIILAGMFIACAILYSGSRTPAVPKDPAYQNVVAQLTKGTIAEEVGLDKKKFAECLASGRYTAMIKEISDAGAKAGIQGTPYSIIITANGTKIPVNGAYPVSEMKKLIEGALSGDTTGAKTIDIPPVSEKDHIYGNPNAEIKIVEYSDTECPFCKQFDATMQTVMAEYKDGGKVAWVFRHFPLDALHQKSRHEAEALECAFELGGNTKFWEYLGVIFKVTPGNDGLDPALL